MPGTVYREKNNHADLPVKSYIILFSLATVAYICGLFVDIMDIDAAQYASIAREMIRNHSYLAIKYRHLDYLDKPPLLFWLSMLSFKIFGYTNWAFKLPSFLSTVLGTYATCKLASVLYNKSVGRLAALLLYTCEAYFLFNNDVRTDTLLANFVIVAIWQLYMYLQDNKWEHAFLGFSAVACAMLSKGPIGLMVPALAIGTHLLYKKRVKDIFHIQWVFAMCWILLLLAPMMLGLYSQYGMTGIKFFFWTQSFGRITGESEWKNKSGYFFFTHSFLWSFLPWSLLAVLALVEKLKQLIKKQVQAELITVSGFVLTFIALSFSHYKLPHYIYVAFPLIAILTAAYVHEIVPQKKYIRWLISIQIVCCILLWIGLILLLSFSFPVTSIIIISLLLISSLGVFYVFIKSENDLNRLIFPSAFTFITVAFTLNIHLYPALLSYQSGSAIARTAFQLKIPKERLYAGWKSNSLEFYYGSFVQEITPEQFKDSLYEKKEAWLVADDAFKEKTDHMGLKPAKIYRFDHFSVTRLKIKFLIPGKRKELLEKHYLMKYIRDQ